MDRATYDALDAVNWSTLRHLVKSPAHYQHYLKEGRPDTPAMLLGRAVHKAALEPRAFTEAFTVAPEGLDRRTREGKAQWAALVNSGLAVLSAGEFGLCLALQAAVRADPEAAAYLRGGEAEVCLQWTDPIFGFACKGLVDFVGDGLLVDLKTTRDASPWGFGRECYNLKYHCQLAHYAQGYEFQYGKRPRVVLIAVEKDGPLAVQCYEIPEDVLTLGRATVDGLFQTLKDCRASGQWHGYGVGTMQLQLPKWAMPDVDADDTGEAGEAW